MYYTGQHCETFFNINKDVEAETPILLSTKLIKLKRKTNDKIKKIRHKKVIKLKA